MMEINTVRINWRLVWDEGALADIQQLLLGIGGTWKLIPRLTVR